MIHEMLKERNIHMKKKYRWNVKKFLSNIYTLVCMLFVSWVILSWIDVMIHNTSGSYTYSNLNMFQFLMNHCK